MQKLPVQISCDISFPVDQAGDALMSQLRLISTFALPDQGRPRGGHSPEPKKWHALSEINGVARLPRGMILDFMKICKNTGVTPTIIPEVRWTDKRESGSWESVSLIRPRDYQWQAIQRLLAHRQGWICLPCGGGKSTIGVVAALMSGQATLVLVHTVDLVDQWIETFKRAGKTGVRRIAQGQGSLKPLRDGEVCVALVHALQEHDATPLIESVGCLIADEVHRAACELFSCVISRSLSRWRWGFTATPERSDGMGFMLPVMFGPCLYTISARELIDLGFLLRPTVIAVKTGWEPKPEHFRWIVKCDQCEGEVELSWNKWQEEKPSCTRKIRAGAKVKICGTPLPLSVAKGKQGDLEWSTTLTALSEDPARIALIGKLAAWAHGKGRRQLVLSARKTALIPMTNALKQAGCKASFVSSTCSDRDVMIKALKSGRLDALVATQLADEGLDVPELDTLISANPGKDSGKATQRAGRACRPAGLPPIVFDLVDRWPTFERQWRSRNAAYREAYGPCGQQEPVILEEALKLAERV